jgi:hypothetical protein
MRWTIEGADSNTGRDLTVTVEARDEADAEQQARYNGVLVARVYPFGVRPKDAAPVPVVDYATAATPKAMPKPPEVAAGLQAGPRAVVPLPDYQPIVAGARALVLFARVVRVAALVLFGVAAVAALLPFLTAWWYGGGAVQSPPVSEVVPALFAAVWPAALGLAMLVAAAVLRMLAFLALAVRDIARNSFR